MSDFHFFSPQETKNSRGQKSEKRSKIKVKVELDSVRRKKRPHGSSTITYAPKKSRRKPEEKRGSKRREKPSSPEKKVKMKTADQVVKALVPHFKAGMIASKEVFKFVARELTHVLLQEGEMPRRDLDSYVNQLFTATGIILTEEDARRKIAQFESAKASVL